MNSPAPGMPARRTALLYGRPLHELAPHRHELAPPRHELAPPPVLAGAALEGVLLEGVPPPPRAPPPVRAEWIYIYTHIHTHTV